MDHFEHSLTAMEKLLQLVGEDHWAQWIGEDIRLWQTEKVTFHHLSAYGGMGSFNDILILEQNGHKVSIAHEPWVNTFFEWLKSICFHLANNPATEITAEYLRRNIGRLDLILVAFVGGDKFPNSMRGLVGPPPTIQGWRCLNCSHSEVTPSDIEWYLAKRYIPEMVFQACEDLSLDRLVDAVTEIGFGVAPEKHTQVEQALKVSGILIKHRDGWMRPCPNCGEDDTAVYRWVDTSNEPVHFEPAGDNLPLIN